MSKEITCPDCGEVLKQNPDGLVVEYHDCKFGDDNPLMNYLIGEAIATEAIIDREKDTYPAESLIAEGMLRAFNQVIEYLENN